MIPFFDAGRGRWGLFDTLSQLNTITVSRLLGAATTTDQSKAVGKARAYYRSCMNTSAIEERGVEGEGEERGRGGWGRGGEGRVGEGRGGWGSGGEGEGRRGEGRGDMELGGV